jgi:hypothetical protein
MKKLFYVAAGISAALLAVKFVPVLIREIKLIRM